MSGRDLDVIRDRLLAMRAELEAIAEVSHEATRPVQLDQASVGRLSRMDAMQAQAMAQASEQRRTMQLAKIEGALRRIDSEEFGECFICGEEIAARRLHADPTTTRCIACQKS